eukprot:TRINITY_DN6462_c0_g2_i22.p3 TRINITY_DN6462_c0_g2~~TRINITY_DN6462_c0_g2_i22.p3  ORF type:complete len:126 (+),score=29.27 TRINITY_DN6462_c0_g2_i22:1547-1924(+)
MFRVFAGGSILGGKLTKELEEKYGSSLLDLEEMNSLKTHPKLYTPGKCIFISGTEFQKTELQCEYIDPSHFDEILIHHSTNIFTYHLPDQYRLFLHLALQQTSKKGCLPKSEVDACDPFFLHGDK